MSKQIEKLAPGMRLYTLTVRNMGNTTVKNTAVHRAEIISVADDKKSFVASWNGNPSRTYRAVPAGWKLQKPYLLAVRHRQATKIEIADAKAAGRVVEKTNYFEIVEKKP